jgi:hypothetical protein
MFLALAAASIITLPANLDIEKTYWDCDYATTQTLAGFEEAAICSTVFEKLKADKFKGSFQDFMVWWKANKEREYASRKK